MRKLLVFCRIAALALAGLLMVASPAQAQSRGYKFLEAVKKRDGNKVEEMLANISKGTPGNILINTKDITSGDTALHIVIDRHDYQWLSYLVAKGADVNARNYQGVTPLWLSVNRAFTEAAELLLKEGARVNDPGPAGETPLIAAIHQKNLALVKALVAAGADPKRADSSGRNAIDYARISESSTIASEIDEAEKKAKARSAKSYGPTF